MAEEDDKASDKAAEGEEEVELNWWEEVIDPGPPKEDCPVCKSGAPGWMATFADMATLLMAFFVLLLSFAEMSVPKYKQIAGSLKASFGVKRIVPTITIETARSILVDDFSPAVAEPTVMRNVRQRSDDITQPNVVKKTEEKEADFKTKKAYRSVEEALQEEIDQGQVKVRIEDNKVVVELRDNQTSGGKSDASVAQGTGGPVSQATIDIAAKVVEVQAKMSTEVQVRKQKLASGRSKRGSESEESANKSPGGQTNKINQDIENQYQNIKSDLSKDIAKGLAAVEKVGDQIKVRLASQGSFVSGGANLQPEFAALLGRVGKSLSASKGKMRVEGHTDNVPVAYNGRFKSNWDLSAQRSASVAQFFINESGFKERNVTVAGFADTRPVARNDSA
ncbi:MAG: flagellar motor protein, partial [Cellvibrionales bacterium TMED148]